MSKKIKLTPTDIIAFTKEFEALLATAKIADGKINYNKTIGVIDRKAKIYFSDVAWLKMQALVREFDKEVAWHGVATRGEDESKDEYYITDILVYPQEVTGASVEMDVSKYDEWIRNNAEDERFYNIAMQGHSHVNMGVTPSAVDLTHQEIILEQLTDDMFYIFMIWNKRGDSCTKIYDLAKNVLFETADIEFEVLNDGYGIDAFIKESKTMVKEYKYSGGQSQYWTGYGYQNTPNTSINKTQTTNVVVLPKKEEKDSQSITTGSSQSKKRKGKKKNKRKNTTDLRDSSAVDFYEGYPYDI